MSQKGDSPCLMHCKVRFESKEQLGTDLEKVQDESEDEEHILQDYKAALLSSKTQEGVAWGKSSWNLSELEENLSDCLSKARWESEKLGKKVRN